MCLLSPFNILHYLTVYCNSENKTRKQSCRHHLTHMEWNNTNVTSHRLQTVTLTEIKLLKAQKKRQVGIPNTYSPLGLMYLTFFQIFIFLQLRSHCSQFCFSASSSQSEHSGFSMLNPNSTAMHALEIQNYANTGQITKKQRTWW